MEQSACGIPNPQDLLNYFQFHKKFWRVLLKMTCNFLADLKRVCDHAVGEGVVVDSLMIFVGTCDIEDFVAMFIGIEIKIGQKETRALEDNLRTAIMPNGYVTCGGKIFPESVDDIGADVNLLVAEIGAHGTIGKNIGDVEKCAGVVARVLTLPGIERAAVTIFMRLASRTI